MARRDLSGQRFGRLVAQTVEVKRLYGTRRSVWKCLCDCGIFREVAASDLLRGNTQSCGCLLKAARKDVPPGTRFGNLEILARQEDLRYLCRCNCGQEVSVRLGNLKSGATVSCGCYGRTKAITHGMTYTKEYRVQRARKRRELKKVQDSNWTLEMNQLLKELQPCCVVCESTDRLAVDHVRPLKLGYALKPGNAVVLCIRCNSKKRDKDLSKLDSKMVEKICQAALNFRVHWERRMT